MVCVWPQSNFCISTRGQSTEIIIIIGTHHYLKKTCNSLTCCMLPAFIMSLKTTRLSAERISRTKTFSSNFSTQLILHLQNQPTLLIIRHMSYLCSTQHFSCILSFELKADLTFPTESNNQRTHTHTVTWRSSEETWPALLTFYWLAAVYF